MPIGCKCLLLELLICESNLWLIPKRIPEFQVVVPFDARNGDHMKIICAALIRSFRKEMVIPSFSVAPVSVAMAIKNLRPWLNVLERSNQDRDVNDRLGRQIGDGRTANVFDCQQRCSKNFPEKALFLLKQQ